MQNTFSLDKTPLGLIIDVARSVSAKDIESMTESVYRNAWQLAKDNGFSEILRIWNFIPNINEFTDGIENYQHFCKGRKSAYSKLLSN